MNQEEKKKYEMMRQCADKLDSILCSYQGRGHQSVYIDMEPLVLFVGLLLRDEIKLQSYPYQYDLDIYEDELAVRIYKELAPQTSWRKNCRTQIQSIRMNALKLFAHMGTPRYEGQIYYEDTESVLVCGEILPYAIIQLLMNPLKVNRLYVFTQPHQAEKDQNVYYSFEFTESARDEMKAYVEQIFERIRGRMEWNK